MYFGVFGMIDFIFVGGLSSGGSLSGFLSVRVNHKWIGLRILVEGRLNILGGGGRKVPGPGRARTPILLL